MKRFVGVWILAYVITASAVTAQTNMAAFFRISCPTGSVITSFDAQAGTISWSNSVEGVTNQLQRCFDLSGGSNWVDFVQLASTNGTATGTERIIDLNPPHGMVLIPGGMNCGTNPMAADEWYDEYYPSNYYLSVSAFYMDATEVTKAQWDAVYNWATNNSYSFDNAGSGKAADHPVQRVNWYDCVKWCNARSEMEGKMPCYTVGGSIYRTGQSELDCDLVANGYRLPTADEWEMAARGGLKSKRFGWGNTINHSNANFVANGSICSYDTSPYTTDMLHPDYNEGTFPFTSPVGSFTATGYGLYDMEGNVWEWCNDLFLGVAWSRVVRGGSWDEWAFTCRTGNRYETGPTVQASFLGFRSVLPAE